MILRHLSCLSCTLYDQFRMIFLLASFSILQACRTLHLFWLLISIFFVSKLIATISECKKRCCASNKKEALLSALGLFVDPYQSYTSSDDKFQAKGKRAGDLLRFQVVSVSGNGTPFTKNVTGWDVVIAGPTTIIADLESYENGALKYNCVIRKAGTYSIKICFRGCPLRGCPIKLEIKPAAIDPSKSVMCGRGLGGLPLITDESAKIEIETFDSLGNKRFEGGYSEEFAIDMRLYEGEGQPPLSEWNKLEVHQQVQDLGNGTYFLNFIAPPPGIYETQIRYADCIIQNKIIQCVISNEDNYNIQKIVKRGGGSFKVAIHDNQKAKATINFTTTQVNLAVSKLRFFSSKIATVKLNRNAKFKLVSERLGEDLALEISTANSIAPIFCFSPERRQIFGTFLSILYHNNVNLSGQFEERRRLFYDRIKKRHLSKTPKTLDITVDRANLLSSAFKKLSTLKESKWKATWCINFIGERGIDAGGLRREFLTLLCKELFLQPSTGLFKKLNKEKDVVHPISSSATKNHLLMYTFAGKVLGKCLYDTVVLQPCQPNVHFSRSFYKQFLNIPIHFSDFSQDDPQFYSGKVKYILTNNVDDACLGITFTEEEYVEVDGKTQLKEIELEPNGKNIEVTEKNKLRYLHLLANFRLSDRVKKQTQAFTEGLFSIIPDDLLSFFDEQELELLFCGLPTIPIDDMRAHTSYISYHPEDQEVFWFWAAVESFTEDERAKLLQFITGSSQVPAEGFAAFSPPITIQKGFCDGNLPQAHTCFNTIDIPFYKTYEEFHKKLLIAITLGNEGFDLM